MAELLNKGGGDLSLLSALVDFLLSRGRSWPVDDLLLLLGQLGVLLASEGLGVVGLVPLTEGSRIDGDDGALDQGLGTDQLVVGGVVDDVNDTDLAGGGLGSP